VSTRKISSLSRIGSAIFIGCMAVFALKLFNLLDLGVPKTVLLAGLVASWVIREIGWSRERRAND
jgi:Na+/glutamate symporter